MNHRWPSQAIRTVGVALALLLAGLCSLPAQAHSMPQSLVQLWWQPFGVQTVIKLPLIELEIALGQPLAAQPQQALTRLAPAIARYVGQHFSLATPQGLAWQMNSADYRLGASGPVAPGSEPDELWVTLDWSPPAGQGTRQFLLRTDLVTHEVRSHGIVVWAQHDPWSAIHASAPRLLGSLSHDRTQLLVSSAANDWWGGTVSTFKSGVAHVAIGADHWLFLLLLVVTVPVLAGGSISTQRSSRESSLMRLLWVVSMFTLGHCTALVLTVGLGIGVPAAGVEVAIALSILVTAVNVLHPLFARTELAWVGLFGLVHGLSYASALSVSGMGWIPASLAVVSFNLGIEAIQAFIVLVAWLIDWRLGSTRLYGGFRLTLAGVGLLMSMYWVVQRVQVWLSAV